MLLVNHHICSIKKREIRKKERCPGMDSAPHLWPDSTGMGRTCASIVLDTNLLTPPPIAFIFMEARAHWLSSASGQVTGSDFCLFECRDNRRVSKIINYVFASFSSPHARGQHWASKGTLGGTLCKGPARGGEGEKHCE